MTIPAASIHPWLKSLPKASLPYISGALERLKQSALNADPRKIYIYDLINQRNAYAVGSLSAVLGYTESEIHGLGVLGFAELIHPQDLPDVAHYYQRFATLEVNEVTTIHYRVRRENGEWCYFQDVCTPLMHTSDGFPAQVIGLVLEVTESHVDQSLERAKAELNRTYRQSRSAKQ